MQLNDILFLCAQITSAAATGTVVFGVLWAVKALIFWLLEQLLHREMS
jgi:hypothetical protein